MANKTRRSFLQGAGAMAAGAALLPGVTLASAPNKPSPGWALGVLGRDYLAQLHAFAETLRRDFEAGKLRGFIDAELENEAGRAFWREHPDASLGGRAKPASDGRLKTGQRS